MYLLSWRVSSHRGGWSRRVPAEPSVIQLLRITSLAGNNTAAELWWVKLEREIIDMVFRHLWFRVGPGRLCLDWSDQTLISVLTRHIGGDAYLKCGSQLRQECVFRIIWHESLTASLILSFSVSVTANSNVPKLFSGYWGSFRSSVTSRVLQRSTGIILIHFCV